ncbi:MAG: CoA transferase [Bacteroidetes bacterium]|nr:CoA transferase [Bacteroidota bacterium]
MDLFFKDLKVVELANVLAGPAVGMFFSELGADVVKIENKLTGGDVTRSWKLSCEDPAAEISAYYASVNWNKKSVFIDMNISEEKQQVYELLKNAEIVISNYKLGDDTKLGMDYESIKKINPAIIYASITGFGAAIKRTAYDLVLQAETGFMHMNGTPESGPVKMPVALIDLLAAHQLKEGILIAMIKKLKTGEGSHVSVSLYDSAVASLANQASNWLMAGADPQPIGSLHPNIAPYGELFTTADQKKMVLAVGNNKQFEQLCTILNCTALITDQKFSTNTSRVKNRAELHALLLPFFQHSDSKTLMEQLIKKDVPAGIIQSLKEVFENESAKKLIHTQKNENGSLSVNVRTAVFDLK